MEKEMSYSIKLAALQLIVTVLSLPVANAQTCKNPGDEAEAEQVREQRTAFNTAIAQGDTTAMESLLHKDVVLITGTNSDVYLGREKQVMLWKEDFEEAERAIYVRTSLCIRVSPIAPIALESGAWRGVFNNDSGNFAAGSYAAKWRQVDGDWLLESEIFATESCAGDFCPESKATQ
jgi:hypothetical protein